MSYKKTFLLSRTQSTCSSLTQKPQTNFDKEKSTFDLLDVRFSGEPLPLTCRYFSLCESGEEPAGPLLNQSRPLFCTSVFCFFSFRVSLFSVLFVFFPFLCFSLFMLLFLLPFCGDDDNDGDGDDAK